MSPDGESLSYARKACIPCRRSKRRCDRTLPSCDLCRRKEVECGYPMRQQTASHSSRLTVQQHSLLDQSPGSPAFSIPQGPSHAVEVDANAVYFIAPHIFHQARLEFPKQELPIPAEVLKLLGDASSIREISTIFFRTVHRWLPIISKKSFFTHLLNPLAQRRTEFSLLALCMKLCCTPSDDDAGVATRLYRAAKQFHFEVETASTLSICTLQASILIALYETAHAIYPAAYLTVGACARQGLALGVDKLSMDSVRDGNGRISSWQEVEERRRAWWAVLMFDRFLSLSNPSRALSTEDPPFDAFLPVDDAVWDDWSSTPGESIRFSAGFNLKMGSFARLAQATRLLSQGLRSISLSASKGDVPQPDETSQLRRTLLALVSVVDREATVRKLEYCAPSALSLSTILLLEENRTYQDSPHDSIESSWLPFESLWPESHTALDRLLEAAVSYSATCPAVPDAPHIVPIFLIHVMYQVVSILLRLSQGSPNGGIRDQISRIKHFLGQISTRWRLGGRSSGDRDIIELGRNAVEFPSSPIRTVTFLLHGDRALSWNRADGLKGYLVPSQQ
ncbi:unnamed protein product [Clonostachys rosea]|uniref:Zn(2)-C6 fungal-type domain-containing protein n=1 Tax=Bionectria ochroleuca TaxID=29856 RepID=A0ABY6UET0_BIOOC|nr:unnamed protein product [Clonostachys rosea]